MSAIDVSVVIPTRNRCGYVGRAIKSALAQTVGELEVLVVDDGSIDGTEELVSGVADPRVRYLKKTVSEGVGAARNTGIAEANGRWIAFLDDDDVWAPTKLARQIHVMASNGRTWSYAGDVMVDRALNVLSGGPPPPPNELVRLLERHNAVPAGASNVVVAAESLASAGPFDANLTSSEDWDMWIRLARAGSPDWVCLPLVAFSYHDQNASRDMDAMLRQLDVVARRHGIQIDRARHFRWAAWYALLDGRQGDASRYYARAVAAGDLASFARAFVAMVLPRLAMRRARSDQATGGSDAWIAEARGWLETIKDAVNTP
jgi:glycosyltransferase involved in cell wall biosynthesis